MCFSDRTIEIIWERAVPVANLNPEQWRSDRRGNLIHRWGFGNRKAPSGWTIGRLDPTRAGGLDNLCAVCTNPMEDDDL